MMSRARLSGVFGLRKNNGTKACGTQTLLLEYSICLYWAGPARWQMRRCTVIERVLGWDISVIPTEGCSAWVAGALCCFNRCGLFQKIRVRQDQDLDLIAPATRKKLFFWIFIIISAVYGIYSSVGSSTSTDPA